MKRNHAKEAQEEGPIHPEGTFDARVLNAKADKTANGKDMIRLTFKTSQGKVNGRLIHSPENSKAEWAFFKQLENMGVDGEALDSAEEVAMECVKARVLIRVTHDEYQGSTFAQVGWIDSLPDSGIAPKPQPMVESSGVDSEEAPF